MAFRGNDRSYDLVKEINMKVMIEQSEKYKWHLNITLYANYKQSIVLCHPCEM